MLLTIKIQGAICICLHYFKDIDGYSEDKFREESKVNYLVLVLSGGQYPPAIR